jgi:diguanylate cyclase (GGDEF)-like protein
VGDLLLKLVAERIQVSLRASDSAGRIGGDEFVVLLPHIRQYDDALQIANKIRNTLRETFVVDNYELNISASIGIACYPLHGTSQLELSKCADEAMYQAKAQGRDAVVLYQSDSSPQET